MNIHTKNSEKATQAKAIITRMKDELPLSEESRRILANAFKFVNKGNIDIIKKVIAIHEEHSADNHSLFALSQNEIDDILNLEMAQVVGHVQDRYGKAEVYMALTK